MGNEGMNEGTKRKNSVMGDTTNEKRYKRG